VLSGLFNQIKQVGFKQMDDFVHYFVNGMPVYCHEKEDKNGFRFVPATLVNNKFCNITELREALGVNKKNVERYAKALKKKGMPHLFKGRKRVINATSLLQIR